MKKHELYIVEFNERISMSVDSHDYFYCFGDLIANFRGGELTVLEKNDIRIKSYKIQKKVDLKYVNNIEDYIDSLKKAFYESPHNKKLIFLEQMSEL